MNDYLQGSIIQLIERGRVLLSKIPVDLPREFHLLAQSCRQRLCSVLDRLQGLIDDPKMQLPLFQPERLRGLRRAARDMDFIETIGIAALNRANEDDKRLNVLIERIHHEISYPLLPPVVTLLSQNYFCIYPLLNLLCLPLGEGDSLLHLPDLYHELAHPLIVEKYDPRAKPFQNSLSQALDTAALYIAEELEKEDRRRSPAQFAFYLRQWLRSWAESWAIELFCDLFAVYTIGPAYAWAHLHLCAKRGGNPFSVPTLIPSTHPSDDARMRTMLYGLHITGFSEVAGNIGQRWNQLIAVSGMKPEPEYLRCYPDHVLKDFAQRAYEGVSATGCCWSTTEMKGRVYIILNQAWVEFWNDPVNYLVWEREAVKKLKEL